MTGAGITFGGNESVVGFRITTGGAQVMELDRPVGLERIANGNDVELSRYHCGIMSPDGRLLIAGTDTGLEFWNFPELNKFATIKQSFTRQL